jgi:hypothetical protein
MPKEKDIIKVLIDELIMKCDHRTLVEISQIFREKWGSSGEFFGTSLLDSYIENGWIRSLEMDFLSYEEDQFILELTLHGLFNFYVILHTRLPRNR